MEKLTGFYVKVSQWLNNEKGAQSLEWLGIAALLILVLGIVSSAISDQESGITDIITSIISKIKGMVG
ncbi:hypothetical protein [Oceanobacillus salinisoli]|uniref:hypothetical protein n=1 Tax=Oceanobacillus salinisoli TaxID=2678611 RepID=UPI0012E319FC|nr:hypothetical protein [Oceanobacillus salinisoli]